MIGLIYRACIESNCYSLQLQQFLIEDTKELLNLFTRVGDFF